MAKQLRDLLEEQNPVVKILGWSDDVGECMHCGRIDLKGTLICEHAHGDISYMGSVCGANAYRWGHALERREEAKFARQLEKMAHDADQERKDQAQAEFRKHPDVQEAWRLINAINDIVPMIRYEARKVHPDWIQARGLKAKAAQEVNAKYASWGIKVWG